MLSVIVYGRNDAHGYNPHRRVALSLNCITEMLTNDGDEIVFVDYNTPDQLPTLVEAIADTLTERCLSVMRVIRVREQTHKELFEGRTHLPIVEPVARNVGARRTNPANRWLLSTTTDMVFVPRVGESLSEVCSRLADGFYGLPRYELPEWLWEQLPRSDPRRALLEIGHLGPALRLEQKTLSHEETRFDAPGDFQLVLRDDFFAVDGFDEEMLLGWHVDSNLSRRMLLRRGSIETLEDDVAAYHCNHHRTVTVYHETDLGNDLSRFLFALDEFELPDQREGWGLADTDLEELDGHGHAGREFTAAVVSAIADRPTSDGYFDSRETKYALLYDSSHVSPFVTDALRVSPPDTTLAYVGANRVLESMLAALLRRLGLELAVADLEDPASAEELDGVSDVFIVDLGVDASLVDAPLSTGHGRDVVRLRSELIRVSAVFRSLVELERARLRQGGHPRRFVLVNSSAVFWNAYVLAHLDCGSTTPHSRVRHATVRLQPDESAAAQAANTRALRLIRWMSRRDRSRRRLQVRAGETVRIADLDDYPGFGDGWAFPDRTALWTQGPRSELSVALTDDSDEPCSLTFSFDDFAVQPGKSLRVRLYAEGELVGACEIPPRSAAELRRDHIRDPSRPTLLEPVQLLRRQARALGITRIRSARWLYLRALDVEARRRRLHGSSPRRVPDPALTWRVPLPPGVAERRTLDLVLAQEEPVSWADDRHLALHVSALTIGKTGWRHRLRHRTRSVVGSPVRGARRTSRRRRQAGHP